MECTGNGARVEGRAVNGLGPPVRGPDVPRSRGGREKATTEILKVPTVTWEIKILRYSFGD